MIGVYRALWVAYFQMAAQYRIQMALWLLFSIIRPVIFLAAWTAVTAAQGGGVGGYSAADFAAYYVSLTLVLQLTQSWDSWDFELEVREGKLSSKLLRPLDPIHYAIVDNLTWKVVTIPALLPVLLLIGWSFGAHFSTQPWQLALFVPSVVLGTALRFLFGWMLGLAAFWTTRIRVLNHLVDRVFFIFAGQIAPLSLMPGPLQVIAYALPFGYMVGLPADLLRGGPTFEQALAQLAGQAAWTAAIFVGVQVIWRMGVRQYSAVGA